MDDSRKEEKSKKLDILDQWLKQTLNIGKTERMEKPNQPQTNGGQSNSANLNVASQAKQPVQANSAKPQVDQSVPQRQWHNQPNHGHAKAGQGRASQPRPHHQGQAAKPAQAQQNAGGQKKGRGGFGGGKKRFSGFSGNFNQRHKFQSALRSSPAANPNTATYDPRGVLRIIPIGGLDEVGKNTMIFEYEDAIFLVDLGFQFPEADMLGVDYVIPDINYLKDKVDKIKGIVVTHGHLDHIGGIAYLLNKLGNPPIYAGRLTMGLIQKQLEEHGLMQTANLNIVNFVSDQLMFGKMKVSFFRVTHSIPDSCGLFIETPAGSIVHTGDFKIDLSPAGNQLPPEFAKIADFKIQFIKKSRL